MAFIVYWNNDTTYISAVLPKQDLFIYQQKIKKIYFLLNNKNKWIDFIKKINWFYISYKIK